MEAVLEYRSRQVDEAQQQVAVEEKKRVEFFKRLRERDEEIIRAYEEQQNALSSGEIHLHQAQVFMAYLQRLKHERAAIEVQLSQQAQRVNYARELLKQAMIKKKSLEVLKEKEYRRLMQKITKAEESMLSELTLNRMIYQSKG